jgi:hypothetical protein
VAVAARYERVTHTPIYALGVVDVFARETHTVGPFPPVLGELRFLMTRRLGPAPEDFTPPREMVTARNRGGFFLFSGALVPRAGSAEVPVLIPGRYRWRVESTYYSPAEGEAEWPPESGRFPDLGLLPGAAYPFPDLSGSLHSRGPTVVRGGAFNLDGSGVAGAEVSLEPPLTDTQWPEKLARFITGEDGGWVLVLPDRRRITADEEILDVPVKPVEITRTIRTHLPTGVDLDVPGVLIRLGRENVLRQTALRGRVVRADGRPLAGTTITTDLRPDAVFARNDGSWSYYLPPDQPDGDATVTATAPDGRSATVSVPVTRGGTTIVPNFRFP